MGPVQQHTPKKGLCSLSSGTITSLDNVSNIRYEKLPLYFPNGQVLLLLHVVILSMLSSPLLSHLLIGLFILSSLFPPVSPTSQSPAQKRPWASFSTLALILSCHSDPSPPTPSTARGRMSALGSIHMKLQICFWVSWGFLLWDTLDLFLLWGPLLW